MSSRRIRWSGWPAAPRRTAALECSSVSLHFCSAASAKKYDFSERDVWRSCLRWKKHYFWGFRQFKYFFFFLMLGGLIVQIAFYSHPLCSAILTRTLNRIWRWSLGVTVKVKLTVVSMNREEQKVFESTAAPVRFCYPLKSQSVLTASPLQPLQRRFACVSHRVGSLIAARVLFLYFPWWNSKFCRTTEGTG